MAARSDNQPLEYRPGQLAAISGIYRVVHLHHRRDHEVVAIRGEEFPPCRVCHESVRFYVAQVSTHMTHDPDMAGPLLFVVREGRARGTGKRKLG
jgi:hypothetical protein